VTTAAPLLRDLVEIPTSVQKSDFVVSLAQGITDAERTVGTYVVTDQLVTAFDQALSLVASAVADRRSKGAYLHGSFGSGKSHFMAVLHLLLQHHPAARSVPELAPVVAKHDARLAGTKTLLVPYHFVGKPSMEAGVLGGYVDHITRIHPGARMPAVFADDKLFADAVRMRASIGDERFFAGLGGGSAELEGFGDLAGGWDAAAFGRALAAAPDDEDRRRLAADLVGTFFTSYAALAAGSGHGHVPLDEGLAAISRHAQGLGYDAVVLFLDELVLWLATRMADPDFVAREGAKLSLLVEASIPRPVPIVSIVARQRDLSDFIGDAVPGAQKASFSHGLQWQEGRFGTITLADRNLTAIVERRVLAPKSEAARAEIDAAFAAVTDRADRAVDTLMTAEGDRDAFRRVYPFSPALIEVLVGVSGFLQRERTALKLLLELLVQRRDELTVGQLVPLGDLWDVIDAGEEPFDEALRRHFTKARRLYTAKLRPMLLDSHGVADSDAAALDRRHAFHTDDRLVKTLLLAALVPETRPVRGLTVSRLADLNHGTIRTPIPGQERANVLAKVKRWSAQVGELRVDGDDQDPSVSLQLVGVDVESILDQATSHDSDGARIRMTRDLLGEAIGLGTREALLPAHGHVWRGRKRHVDLAFANVRDPRDLPDAEFRASLDRPKVVLDYPFDPDGRGPADDLARVDALREKIGPTPTLCWLPRSLTDKARQQLGRLVVLDFLLTGDRLDQHTQHLPQLQRLEARDVLTGQRDQLRSHLVEILRQAYGVSAADPEWVADDIALADQFATLDGTVTIRPPTATSLRDAFHQLLDQLWAAVAPAHPKFPEEVRKGELVRTLELFAQAAAREDRRIDVPTADRRLLAKVIAPLKLGQVGEAHFTLDRHWRDHFHRMQAAHPGPLTVSRLREWMDSPLRMALDEPLGNLVISSYALDDDRVLSLDGLTLPPTVDRLDARVEVRTVDLPPAEVYATAADRAPRILGVGASPVRSAANVAALARDVRAAAEPHREAVRRLTGSLPAFAERVGVGGEAPRPRNALVARTLVDGVTAAEDDAAVIRFLAGVDLPTTAEALGASIKQARPVGDAIDRANVGLLVDVAFALGPPWAGEAEVIRRRLVEATAADQLTTDLAAALDSAGRDATALVGKATAAPKTDDRAPHRPEVRPADPTVAPSAGQGLPTSGSREGLTGEDARRLLQQLLDAGEIRRLAVDWELGP
jgi:hypothetical protein